LKEFELEVISELVRNCRRSDGELARALHVSQPTVTRTRTKLEKQGLIEYTILGVCKPHKPRKADEQSKCDRIDCHA
jgi:Mn-dependent DtxR family transcriptional regulator